MIQMIYADFVCFSSPGRGADHSNQVPLVLIDLKAEETCSKESSEKRETRDQDLPTFSRDFQGHLLNLHMFTAK